MPLSLTAFLKRLVLPALLLSFPLGVVGQTNLIVRAPKVQYTFRGLNVRLASPLHRPRVGLVLSGGGSRSLAQVGVLKVLEEHGVPIDLIVGNSMGAVLGGLYASGYTTTQLESLAVHANWDDVLAFSEDTKRREVFVGDKGPDQTGFLVIRFDGLQPIIPSSVSSGQRLTNYFMNLTLQALYHPYPSFDDLKIPFRAVATDLISGKRVILDRGSLAEAMRASVTVPLLYSSLQKDSMALVDGGLLSNIPVDLAKSLGCDVVIAVNSVSTMRHEDQMNKPWEVADQIMTIMMQSSNQIQLKLADVVITPDVGSRIVSDFAGIDTLVAAGERAAESSIGQILRLIPYRADTSAGIPERTFNDVVVEFQGDSIPESARQEILDDARNQPISTVRIQEHVQDLLLLGMYQDVYAEIAEHASPTKIIYHVTANPRVSEIRFSGNDVISDKMIESRIMSLQGSVLDYFELQRRLESVLELYRENRFSLARVESVRVDLQRGTVHFTVNEGTLGGLYFEGNEQTRDYVIRREFPLDKGDIFNLDDAYKGLINITSTGLFESVLLDVRYRGETPILVLKVSEKSSELLRLGLHADNEHGLVGTIDVRDANFRGAGENLGLSYSYGFRDRLVEAEYRANRIFQTYLTFNLKGYYSSRDILTYSDSTIDNAHWDRIEDGKYEEIRYGGSFTFGTQLERLGNVTAVLRAEHDRVSSLSGVSVGPEDYRLVGLKLQSTVDTENKFEFPTAGVLLTASFETALRQLGSEVSFEKIGFTYESYTTILERHTLHPRITFGFADEPLPIMEQYTLGGFNSFYGLRENDSRGRHLFLINMEYRYWLPFKLVFETYARLRYDLGTISDKTEELKLNSFHHGIGIEIAVDTPLGSASVGMGKSFYYSTKLLGSPPTVGPLLLYFSIGHSL